MEHSKLSFDLINRSLDICNPKLKYFIKIIIKPHISVFIIREIEYKINKIIGFLLTLLKFIKIKLPKTINCIKITSDAIFSELILNSFYY